MMEMLMMMHRIICNRTEFIQINFTVFVKDKFAVFVLLIEFFKSFEAFCSCERIEEVKTAFTCHVLNSLFSIKVLFNEGIFV